MLPLNEAIAELKRFDQDFRAAEEESDFGSVPDGKYEVIIDKMDLGRTPNAGYIKITWQLRVTGPTHQNRVIFKSSVVTPNSLRFIKADLRKCSVPIEDLSALPAHLDKLTNLELSVTKRTSNGYENIYIDRCKHSEIIDDLPF